MARSATMLVLCPRGESPEQVVARVDRVMLRDRKFADSPLEGDGFESSVPPQSRKNFCRPSAKPGAEHRRELASMIQLMPPQARSRGSVSREYRASRPTELATEGTERCYEAGREEIATSSMHLTDGVPDAPGDRGTCSSRRGRRFGAAPRMIRYDRATKLADANALVACLLDLE